MERGSLYIGVMSGTSIDAVDTALVEITSASISLIDQHTTAIPEPVKQAILSIASGEQTNIQAIGQLDNKLGYLYAEAVNQLLEKSAYQAKDITAIGNHGQTVFHQPQGDSSFTMQLGDANIIACKTGITTIADFRRKDMALGGQGAPLVPAFHQSVFAAKEASVVVLNIGGIANISVLQPDKPTKGYDTGPGNMLLDSWIKKQLGKAYDHDAAYCRSGKIIPELLSLCLQENYFSLTAPKSTGRELFNLGWLEQKLSQLKLNYSGEDVQATLVELTAVSITEQVKQYQTGSCPELLVCGGGANNPAIMSRLSQLLPQWHVCRTDDRGVSSDSMEAMAFAWLARQRIYNLPSNLPEVTGASKAASLGVIYPAESEEF